MTQRSNIYHRYIKALAWIHIFCAPIGILICKKSSSELAKSLEERLIQRAQREQQLLEECQNWQRTCQEQTEENNKLREQLSSSFQNLIDLKMQITGHTCTHKAEIERIKGVWQTVLDTRSQQIQQHKLSQHELSKQRDCLLEELANCTEQLHHMEERLCGSMETHQAEVEQYRSQLHALELHLHELEQQSQEEQKQVQLVLRARNALYAENQELLAALKHWQEIGSSLPVLQQAINDKHDTLSQLHRTIALQQQEVLELKEVLSHKNNNDDQMQNKIAELEAKIAQQNNDFASQANDLFSALLSEKLKLEQRLAKRQYPLAEELERTKEELSCLQASRNQLLKQLQEVQSALLLSETTRSAETTNNNPDQEPISPNINPNHLQISKHLAEQSKIALLAMKTNLHQLELENQHQQQALVKQKEEIKALRDYQEESVNNYQTKINSIEKQLKNQAALEQEIEQLNHTITQLNNHNQALHCDKDELKNMLSSTQEEQRQLTIALQAREACLAQAQAAYQESLLELQKTKIANSQEILPEDSRWGQWQQDWEEWCKLQDEHRAQIQEQERILDLRRDQVVDLQKQFESKRAKVYQLKAQIAELYRQLAGKNGQCCQQEERLKELSDLRAYLEAAKATSKEAKAAMQKECLTSKAETIQQIECAIQRFKALYQNMAHNWQAQRNYVTQAIRSAGHSKADLYARIRDLTTQLEGYKHEEDKLKTTTEQASQLYEQTKLQLDQTNQRLACVQEELKSLIEAKSSAEAGHEQKDTTIQLLQNQIALMEKKNATLEKTITKRQKEHAKMSNRIIELSQLVTNEQQRASQLQEAVDQLSRERLEWQTKAAAWQQGYNQQLDRWYNDNLNWNNERDQHLAWQDHWHQLLNQRCQKDHLANLKNQNLQTQLTTYLGFITDNKSASPAQQLLYTQLKHELEQIGLSELNIAHQDKSKHVTPKLSSRLIKMLKQEWAWQQTIEELRKLPSSLSELLNEPHYQKNANTNNKLDLHARRQNEMQLLLQAYKMCLLQKRLPNLWAKDHPQRRQFKNWKREVLNIAAAYLHAPELATTKNLGAGYQALGQKLASNFTQASPNNA